MKSKKQKIDLLDVVALTVDLPEYNLWRGQVGTVVESLANGTAFEVEFSDREGQTFESVGLRPEQIMVLHYDPIGGRREPWFPSFPMPIFWLSFPIPKTRKYRFIKIILLVLHQITENLESL